VQEFLVSKDEQQLAPCQVPKDNKDDHGSGLDDLELIVAPFESYLEFLEDKGEYLNAQECSLIPPISVDKIFQEKPHVNQVEKSQQEASYVPITIVVQEQHDNMPLQQEEPLLVQLEDDIPYTLPMILHPEVVRRGPEIDQCLDIKVHHDPVELNMMEVFQQEYYKSFVSHAFMLVTIEMF
jgi:hypothetical protein